MNMNDEPEPMLSLDQAALELGCSRDTVRRMISRGEIKAVRVGARLIRIRRSDLERAIKPVARISDMDPDA